MYRTLCGCIAVPIKPGQHAHAARLFRRLRLTHRNPICCGYTRQLPVWQMVGVWQATPIDKPPQVW